MILNVGDANYEIDKLSPLTIDIDTLTWKPVTIVLKANSPVPDLKNVKILTIKGYFGYNDAEIIAENEITVSENVITIPEVAFCTILD